MTERLPATPGLLFGAAILIYLGFRLVLIRLRFSLPIDRPAARLTPEELLAAPGEDRAFLESSSATLAAEGFLASERIRSQGKHVKSLAILLENPATGDRASIAVIRQVRRGRDVGRIPFLGVFTDLEDGWRIATANSVAKGILPPRPRTLGLHLPGVLDPRRVAAAHRCARQLWKPGVAAAPAAGGLFERHLLDVEEVRTRLERHGILRTDENLGVRRPTWKGAVVFLWRTSSLRKALVRAAAARRTRRVLEALGAG